MKIITDFSDMDFSECIDLICDKCNLKDGWIICKVEERNWREANFLSMTTKDDLYEFLDELIQSNDCKNGCELREDNGEYYFSIVGSNRYDAKTGEFIATDVVNVRFRNYVWE